MIPIGKRIIAAGLINGALALPVLAVAQSNNGPTIGVIAQALAQQTVLVATWITVIMWVVTGLLFLTSVGKPERVSSARLSLFAAIGGTILVIIAQGAVALVKNSLGI